MRWILVDENISKCDKEDENIAIHLFQLDDAVNSMKSIFLVILHELDDYMMVLIPMVDIRFIHREDPLI